jgi:hypothetical protein
MHSMVDFLNRQAKVGTAMGSGGTVCSISAIDEESDSTCHCEEGIRRCLLDSSFLGESHVSNDDVSSFLEMGRGIWQRCGPPSLFNQFHVVADVRSRSVLALHSRPLSKSGGSW